MEHRGDFVAVGQVPVKVAVEHPQMLLFDRLRELLAVTGLPPLPDVYDLLWRHLADDDFQLSRAVGAAIAAGTLDLVGVATLRQAHFHEVSLRDVSAMVAAAHAQAIRITERLVEGRSDLAVYGQTIADGDAVLNGDATPTTPALTALIDRLGTATGAMLVANRRLEIELTVAAEETGHLRLRLHAAERAAVTDPLTGLLNRRGIVEALVEAQRQTRETGNALSVAMVDIDHFKRFNDRWGHSVGDDVLCYVADHLADGIAAHGTGGAVGRLGGEEFIAVLPGVVGGDAVALVDRVRAMLAAQIIRRTADGMNLGRLSFSAGVATDRSADAAATLIGRADAALYTAKRLGRDRVIPDLG